MTNHADRQTVKLNTGEKFELLECMDSGCFAMTYRARVINPVLAADWGQEVAIKIPLTKKYEHILIDVNYALYHFHTMLGEHDENIVKFLGHSEYDGRRVLIMEYVPGSLRDRMSEIGEGEAMPINEALDIMEGVLNGLKQIHERAKIVHRDIKPENIILDGSVAKISDLYISGCLTSHGLAEPRTGTLPYMSPESLGEQGVRFNTDLWSLGVTLYEMLTGQRPFGRRSTPLVTLIDMIRTSDHEPAKDLNPAVPDELSYFIDKALEKDPSQRFATAAEMLEELQKIRTNCQSHGPSKI